MNDQDHSYSAGGVIVSPLGKVVVVSQNGNSWSLPKGTLETGEDKITAAMREIEEETGLTDLELIKELGTYSRFRIGLEGGEDKSHKKQITFYLFTTRERELHPIDPDNPEARWVDLEEVETMLTHPKDKEFFVSIKPEVIKKLANN